MGYRVDQQQHENEIRRAAKACMDESKRIGNGRDLADLVTPAQTAPGKPLPAAKDALNIYDAAFGQPEFIVDRLLPLGYTVMAGRPKSGKSWLALQIAVAIATGGLLCGWFRILKPGRVTYLALEEPQARTHHRLHLVAPQRDVRLQNIQLIYELQPLMTGGAEQINAFLKANPSEAMVIDTILATTSKHSSRRDIVRGDYNEGDIIRRIAGEHGCAVLGVAHSRKAAGDVVDSVLGTSGATASCDSVWSLKRLNTEEATLEVTGREIEAEVYGLKFNQADPFGWVVTSMGEEAGMSEQRRDILMVLQQEGAKRPADIARLLVKNAVTVRRLIQKMAYDGVVVAQPNGTYIPNVNNVNAMNGGDH